MSIRKSSSTSLLISIALSTSIGSTSLSAQTLTSYRTAATPLALTPSIDTFYTRSLNSTDSAFFKENAGENLNLSAILADAGSLHLNTGLTRELDALEVRNIWSSTALSYTSQNFKIFEHYDLTYDAGVILPTNEDKRNYLSYRGSFKSNLHLNRELEIDFGIIDKINLGVSAGVLRNFYEFDASISGTPNKTLNWKEKALVSLQLFKVLTAKSEIILNHSLRANGSWLVPDYQAEFELAADLNSHLNVSLNQATEDRALSYDYQTAKIALYDQQVTVYTATATYTL